MSWIMVAAVIVAIVLFVLAKLTQKPEPTYSSSERAIILKAQPPLPYQKSETLFTPF